MEEVAHVPLAALVGEQDKDAKALQKPAAVRKRLLDVAWVEEAKGAFGRNEVVARCHLSACGHQRSAERGHDDRPRLVAVEPVIGAPQLAPARSPEVVEVV